MGERVSSGGQDTWGEADGAAEQPASVPERYELLKEIGAGAMGRVWLAHDRVLAREVAYKELAVQATPDAIARFLREARVTGRLDHPSIVPIHDAGRQADGRMFYVMRLLRGRSLAAVLQESSDLSTRTRWLDGLISVCQGIAHAHEHGVVHRDLKPANLMIGHYGEIQVVDWGLAKVLAEPSPGAESEDTRSGAILGTPMYMSPEQASGERLTPATDVWSLGVILFEILTGVQPFRDADPWAILRAIATRDAPDVLSLAPAAPPELAAITRRALTRDLRVRYADASALLADLESWRSGARVSAYRYSTWEELRRLAARHRASLLALGAAVGAALVVGLAAFDRVITERDNSRSAEGAARRAEAAANAAREEVSRVARGALVAQALAQVNDPISALTFAAEALRLGSEPTARGIVARHFGTEPWQVQRHIPAGPGPCADLVAVAGRVACAGPAGSWVAEDGTGLRWSDPEPAVRISLSGDGRLAAVATEGGLLRVVEADTGSVRWERPNSGTFRASPSFSRDATRVAWGVDRLLVVADVTTGEDLSRTGWNSLVGAIAWSDNDSLLLSHADSAIREVEVSGTEIRTFPPVPGMRGLYAGAFSGTRDALLGLSMAGRVTWRRLDGGEIALRDAGSAGRVGLAHGDRAAWEADEAGFEAWRLPEGTSLGRMPGLPSRASVWMDDADRVYVPTADALAVYRRGEARVAEWHRSDGFHLCAPVPGDRLDCLAGSAIIARLSSGTTAVETTHRDLPPPHRAFATDDAGNAIVSHGTRLRYRGPDGDLVEPFTGVVDFVADRAREQVAYFTGSRIALAAWPERPEHWTELGADISTVAEVPTGWLVLTEAGFVHLDRMGGLLAPPAMPPALHVVADPVTGRVATWEGVRVGFREPDGAVIGPGYAGSRRTPFVGAFLRADRFALIEGADVLVLDVPSGAVWARLVAHPRLADIAAMIGLDGLPNGRLATVGYDGRVIMWDLPAAEGTGSEVADRVVAATGWRLDGGRAVPALR